MDQNNSEYGHFLRSAPFSNKNSNSDKTIDAVSRKCSVKKAFLEISQNSQETPVLETVFNQVAAKSDIFTEVILNELYKSLGVGNFPCTMKLANVALVYKKAIGLRKRIIDRSAYCQTYQKFLK